MIDRRTLLVGAAGASIPWPALAQDGLARVDALATKATALGMFNGIITIDRAGDLIFNKAYGLADYESHRHFDRRTRFRIASISKVMTNAALASLAMRGKLRLSDTLDRYFPNFPSAGRITLQMITEHRSGIPHTNDQYWGDGSITLSHEEILRRLAALPLDFEPGTRRRYSNGGYAVLARAMELAHAQPYRTIMCELVFKPAGMSDAGEILDTRRAIPHVATGYLPGLRPCSRQIARFYAAETRQGGGSLYASAEDVLAFFRRAWRGQLEGAREFPDLFGGTGATRTADGRAPGFYMDVHYVRDEDLLVCSTANNYAAETYWARSIAQLVLGHDLLLEDLPSVDTNRAPAAGWAGCYHFEDRRSPQSIEISESSGSLLLTDRATGAERALLPLRSGDYLDPLYYWVGSMRSADHIAFTRAYPSDFSIIIARS